MQRKNFWRSKLFLVILITSILLLLSYKNPGGFFHPFQSVGHAIITPVQHLGSALGYGFQGSFGILDRVTNLKKENSELQKKNLQLMAENAALEQLGAENNELKRNLELLPKENRQYLAATVITRDPSGVQNTVTIDKGSDDGVREGMAAVVETGVLIGRVQNVFNDSATITLVSNHENVVNVETSRSAIRGIARGEHGINITLDMVEQGKELKEGDALVTSGLGGQYPRGLLVGTLSNLRFSDDKLFQQATVNSPVRLNSVRFIFLIR